jgi:DegV family protein with EDD domain
MSGVRVVTDSACDLPNDLAVEYEIEIVPLTIRFGDEEFVDRRDLSPKEFWARCATSPVLPETAAPSAGAFEEVFRRVAASGADGVVCINLSSKLSATIQAAQMGAKAVETELPVRVIDSLSVTMGLGTIVLAAAKLAAEGKSLDDIAGAAEDLVPRTRVLGTLDTLENLKKGGRIGGAKAMLGSMLSLKPVIWVQDGEVQEESKQRTRGRALRYLVEKFAEQARQGIDDLAVMHGDAPDLDEFLDLLSAHFPRDEIVVGDIGAVIGTHAGPRVMGVAYNTTA